MSRVSVVIPCYNAGRLLEEAVQSALSQTYADLEVIIVDDGSTDGTTRALLDEARWPRTRIIRQSNRGPAAARNTAIREATGEFILPLDSDDRIASTYVEKAVAAMHTDPEVGIVYCKAMKFGEENGPWQLPAFTLRELVIDNVIFVTSLFRKADWERVGGFDERMLHGVEDYDFWIRIVALGRKVVQLDEHLFFYRIQKASRTTDFQRDRAVVVHVYADIFRRNAGFFAEHAEYLFEHRFALYDQIEYYRQRYGRLDAFLQRHSFVRGVASRLARWLMLR